MCIYIYLCIEREGFRSINQENPINQSRMEKKTQDAQIILQSEGELQNAHRNPHCSTQRTNAHLLQPMFFVLLWWKYSETRALQSARTWSKNTAVATGKLLFKVLRTTSQKVEFAPGVNYSTIRWVFSKLVCGPSVWEKAVSMRFT